MYLMRNYISNFKNRNGYGQLAYNYVKKKGGILCVEKFRPGLKLYFLR